MVFKKIFLTLLLFSPLLTVSSIIVSIVSSSFAAAGAVELVLFAGFMFSTHDGNDDYV
ncbi:MAG: hypothetical protein WA631_11620 [Nitrososphaeraceae archaeon]